MDKATVQLNLELYKKVYLIRAAEQKICEHYHENQIKTPVHMSIGEEAIVAGVCHAISPEHYVLGTYRSHGVYLAVTGETDKYFAELYGKKTGLANGMAGSMHLSAPEHGFLGTSAIVGGIIPIATGVAFANKYKDNDKVVAVFFGDGALDEGAFWESLNCACVMKLPVLFVCEDNGLAIHTPKHLRHGYSSITDIISKFDCTAMKSETTDVETIYNLTIKSIELIKTAQQPVFLHLKYYRYLAHVGPEEDFDAGYRSRDDFEKWYKVDPVAMQEHKLLRLGYDITKIEEIKQLINKQLERSVESAKNAPFPDTSELYMTVRV